MVELTLLELHVHDGVDFSPRGVIGGDDGGHSALADETSETDTDAMDETSETDTDAMDETSETDTDAMDETSETDTDATNQRSSLLRRGARTAVGVAAVGTAAYVVRRRRAGDDEETDVEVEIEESEPVAE
ncbi:hypothetical protein [Halobaculum sp. MBLA0143]|uniref:hypothetical protein n=1 Tax=Halobaculum sp. MBLA0143 TaxID=3079933 RepID=UPI00352365BF